MAGRSGAACRSSPSSAARTSARARCSTGSSATRTAIVEDRARTTRDRLYGDAEWNGRRFVVVDTGGLELDPDDPIEAQVQEQARLAIAEADVIVFVVDAVTGLTPADHEAAELLRRATAPVIVAVNKADNEQRELDGAEFYALGWEETYAISATHGRGTGDLLDAIVWALPPESEAELARKAREAEADAWADEVAAGRLEPFVVGDAEAGDADGDDGAEATPISTASTPRRASWDAAIAAEADEPAGDRVRRPARTSASRACSTRCSARTGRSSRRCRARPATPSTRRLAWGRSEVVLIDTAGIRRRGKVAVGPGRRAATRRSARSRRSSRADVAVLVIDAVEGLTAQDAHVAGYVVEEGKGLVIAVNKWDLVEDKTDQTFDQYVEWIRNEVPFLDFAPIVSISAKTGQRVGRVLEAAIDIWGERRKRISTGELNRVLPAATERHAAAAGPRPPAEALLRDAGRGRAADVRVLRLGRAARSTSATGATSRTGCARRSASTGRRSGSSSATATSVKLPRRKKLRERRRSRRGKGPRRGDRRAGRASRADGRELMARSARRGRRRGRVGHDAGRRRRPGRSRSRCSCHSPETAARIAATAAQRARGCRASTCRRRVVATADPARARATRPTSSSSRSPSAHLRDDRRARSRRSSRPAADVLSVVKGLERGHAAADERGHRRGGRIVPRPDRRAVGPEPRRRDRPRPAGVGGRRGRGPELAERVVGAARPARVPALRQQRHPRRRAVRGAQERRRDRGRRGRRARLRRQRQGRADDPRPGRDDPARDRRRREPADLRRAGRDRRRHRDLRVARCRATTGSAWSWPRAGRGPRSRRRCRASPRAPTRSTRRSALADRLGVEMPIAREVHNALFEGKSVQRCLIDLLARESKDELADYRPLGRARLEADAEAGPG